MRYCDIQIDDPKNGGQVVKHWSSIQSDGTPDPGALRVQMDLFVVSVQAHNGNSSLTIYGVALDDLYNANNLYGKHIEVRGGFTSGLPLEKPYQAGVLFAGNIFQSVGNWVSTDMSISLMINPTVYSHDNPGNYVLSWHKGQPPQRGRQRRQRYRLCVRRASELRCRPGYGNSRSLRRDYR